MRFARAPPSSTKPVSPMSRRSDVRPRRRAPAPSGPVPVASGVSRELTADDRFFRHIVSSMRNGVIAIQRDGAVALMNDEAYRIFALTRPPPDVGRSFTDVLRPRPDIVRVLAGAFEMSHLPNRAELRLKDMDRVI